MLLARKNTKQYYGWLGEEMIGVHMFSGSIVALVTPMQSNGEIDIATLERLINWHLDQKTDGIFVTSTTGETPTLTSAEQLNIIRTTVKQVAGRVPVFAGTGTNCTSTSIENTRIAMEAGVDACILVTPYYNKPTQQGLIEHFTAVAKANPVPILLYNVPGRTGCDLLPESVARLAEVANIVGIKECMGVERATKLLEYCGDKIDLFSGNDDDAFETMKLGYKGVISVTANVAPKLMHEFCAAMLSTHYDKGQEIYQILSGLHRQLFAEPNPIPVKWALQHMGLIPPGIRLPLTPLSEQYHAAVITALRQAENIH